MGGEQVGQSRVGNAGRARGSQAGRARGSQAGRARGSQAGRVRGAQTGLTRGTQNGRARGSHAGRSRGAQAGTARARLTQFAHGNQEFDEHQPVGSPPTIAFEINQIDNVVSISDSLNEEEVLAGLAAAGILAELDFVDSNLTDQTSLFAPPAPVSYLFLKYKRLLFSNAFTYIPLDRRSQRRTSSDSSERRRAI